MGKRRGFTERELRILRGISEEQTEKMKGTRFWRNLDFLLYLFLVVVLAFGVRNYLVEPVRVDGESMVPTLVDGEHMLVEKASYWFRTPARGEIIICYYPGYTESCVKRVIGLPGETVQIEGGIVYINGAPLDERDYWNDTIAGDYPAYTVPEGMVFVMGDNRNYSKDSRNASVGAIPPEKVVGRVLGVLWPLDRARLLSEVKYE